MQRLTRWVQVWHLPALQKLSVLFCGGGCHDNHAWPAAVLNWRSLALNQHPGAGLVGDLCEDQGEAGRAGLFTTQCVHDRHAAPTIVQTYPVALRLVHYCMSAQGTHENHSQAVK